MWLLHKSALLSALLAMALNATPTWAESRKEAVACKILPTEFEFSKTDLFIFEHVLVNGRNWRLPKKDGWFPIVELHYRDSGDNKRGAFVVERDAYQYSIYWTLATCDLEQIPYVIRLIEETGVDIDD